MKPFVRAVEAKANENSEAPEGAVRDTDGPRLRELTRSVRDVLSIADQLGMVQKLPPVLTVEQAAEVLGLNRKTVYAAINRRELPGVRWFGRTARISTEALMTWMFKGRGGRMPRRG